MHLFVSSSPPHRLTTGCLLYFTGLSSGCHSVEFVRRRLEKEMCVVPCM